MCREHVATKSRINGALKKLSMPSREHRVVEGVPSLKKGKWNNKDE